MAEQKSDVASGIVITMLTSGFMANIRATGIDFDGMARGDIDTTGFDSEIDSDPDVIGSKEFIPEDHVDAGGFSLDIHFNPNVTPPIKQPAEQIEIDWPLVPGGSTPAKFTFIGYMNNFAPSAAINELMTGTGSWKITGGVTFVKAA